MRDLEWWANLVQVLSFPIAVVTFALMILFYFFPKREDLAPLLKKAGFVLPYIFCATIFFWLGSLNSSITTNKKVTQSLPTGSIEPQKLTPTTLRIVYNISNYEETISELSSNLNLRELEALESDKPVEDIPFGTYFFVPGIYLSFEVGDNADIFSVQRFKTFESFFELHLSQTGELFLIGFASKSQASNVAKLDGEVIHKITVFPSPWEQASSIISIPFNRIIAITDRTINASQNSYLDVLDVSLQ
jgi:hypothetical protein